MEGKPKSPQDQLQEIEKLVTDAARLLDQALFARRNGRGAPQG
jgi:hypothetical protein